MLWEIVGVVLPSPAPCPTQAQSGDQDVLQGQPSGEAFIQMTSESSAFQAAQQKHHRYMIFGKKQRYIEVFQCSGEDMNLVLTGGAVSPVAKALLSPGMLSSPPPPPTQAPPTHTPVPAPVFDPLMAAMQAQAIAQIRQQHEVWLMNQLAVAQAAAAQQQQQQHVLALALAAKQPQTWTEYMTSIPPPHAAVSSSVVSNAVSTKPIVSFPTTHSYVSAVNPAPYFVLNFPPRIPPPAAFPKVNPPPAITNPYAAYGPLPFVPPPTVAAAPPPLKRSWEQAFPVVGGAEAGATAAKRTFPSVTTPTSQSFPSNLPPPPPANQVTYQQQFYPGL